MAAKELEPRPNPDAHKQRRLMHQVRGLSSRALIQSKAFSLFDSFKLRLHLGECRVQIRHYGLGAALQRILQTRHLCQHPADICPECRYPGLLCQRDLGSCLLFYVGTGWGLA